MDCYCEICVIFINSKSKYKHFKSKFHNEFDKCKHIKITMENPDKNDIDEKFYAYIIEHNKKFDHYLVKCEFKLVFKDYEHCPCITSKLFDNKTMCFWQKFLANAIKDFDNKEYNLNHRAEMSKIKISNKLDMSFDFHIRHNMHAVEWRIKTIINENENLINNLNRIWRHPLVRKLNRIPILNMYI